MNITIVNSFAIVALSILLSIITVSLTNRVDSQARVINGLQEVISEQTKTLKEIEDATVTVHDSAIQREHSLQDSLEERIGTLEHQMESIQVIFGKKESVMNYRGIVILNEDRSWTFRAIIDGGFWKNYRITKETATKMYDLAANDEINAHLKDLEDEENAKKSKTKTRNVRKRSAKTSKSSRRRAA